MPSVFISYRRDDTAGWAGRLHEELEQRLGRGRVFRDVDTLTAGDDFDAAIRARLAQCRACVVLIGPRWLAPATAGGERRLDRADDYVALEIGAALARPDVLVVPVLVGGAAMPAAAELPEALRTLARRHAMSVRDETWEADMDRLALVLDGDARRADEAAAGAAAGRPPRRPARGAAYAVAGAAIVGAVAIAVALSRSGAPAAPDSSRPDDAATASSRDGDAAAPNGDGGPDAATGGANADASRAGVAASDPSPASAIDVPTTGAEVALGRVVYAPLAGSVQRRGDGLRVWLRIRASNEGYTPINLWDRTFRLVVGGQSVAASGGLNDVLDRRTIAQAVVRFDVPTPAAAATLRIADDRESGDIALDLTANGTAAKHDAVDPRDALSHAVLRSVGRDAALPLVAGDVEASLQRANLRRYVNKQRLAVVVKWHNRGRYPVATGDLVLRAATPAGDRVAPVEQPNAVVDGGATHIGDVVFELAPDVATVTLDATLHDARGQTSFALR